MGIPGAACLWEASSGHHCLPPQMPGSVPISKGSPPNRSPLAALHLRVHGSYRIQVLKDQGSCPTLSSVPHLIGIGPQECLGLEGV